MRIVTPKYSLSKVASSILGEGADRLLSSPEERKEFKHSIEECKSNP